jgi:putative PIN family toxin of toxin-antitoxin system
MRIIVDANVFISYLLTSKQLGTISAVVEHCFSDEIHLIVPQELVHEIRTARDKKEYLRIHIPLQRLDQFLSHLLQIAEVPEILEEISTYAADPNDDYLLAYGLIEQVDYLITGDALLLSLRQVRTLKIVDPVEFLEILRQGN